MIQWLEKKRREPIVITSPRMDALEMAAALRVGEDNPLWRALMQTIEEELHEVRAVATQSVKDHGILASWVGGMEALERLRLRLIQDRATAMGEEK